MTRRARPGGPSDWIVPRRVVVIGAGPAGCAAAYHLRRRLPGATVTIIERAAFPRAKVCGEFVSPAATGLLEAVLPAPALIALGAKRVRTVALIVGERRRAWALPRAAWSLSRATLDAALLDACRASGVSVVQPAAVRDVDYANDRVRVRLADGSALDADFVVHADGSGRHDPAGPVPLDDRAMGHKCHLRPPPGLLRGIEMRACGSGTHGPSRGARAYVGTIAVEGDLATCALAADKRLLAAHVGDPDAMLRSLWPEYDPAWRCSEWQASGIARCGYRRPGHARSFRVGNAAAAVDPVGGEGIGLALWAGTRLARTIAERMSVQGDTLESGFAASRVHADFARAYRSRLRTRLPACRLGALVLSRAWLARALWPLLGVPALTVRPWLALTGKPSGRTSDAGAGGGTGPGAGATAKFPVT